jgi:hypothetical protein
LGFSINYVILGRVFTHLFRRAITVTVNPGFDPGAVIGDKTIGFGASTDVLTLIGCQGSEVGWQKRNNGNAYIVIPNTSGSDTYSEVPAT